MNRYRKPLIYAGLAILVVFAALALSVFLFKERIIRQFILEANKELNTPVKIGKLDVSILRHFPRLSIVLNDVYIEDSHHGNYPLFTAGTVAFSMHPYEVYQGIYQISGVYIENSETNLKIDANGVNNYTVLKKSEGGGGALSLELKDVELRNTRVRYLDLDTRQDLVFQSDKLAASITTEKNIYDIEADGHVSTELLSINGKSYFEGKSFLIESFVTYDDNNRSVKIAPSILQLAQSEFSVKGDYIWKDKKLIDLIVDGRDTDLQTIISLLPASVSEDLRKYRSDGEVYFSGHLLGELGKSVNPGVNVSFGFRNATIFHPEYQARITAANMEGSFMAKDVLKPAGAELSLKKITGALNGKSFSGNLRIKNFDDPYVTLDFKGDLDAGAVLGFYPLTMVRSVSGGLHADLSIDGKIALLKNRNTASQVATRGTIDLKNISLQYGADKVPVRELSGNLQFSNSDLALSNVAGSFGNSDFILNGFFKNVVTFLLFENQPIGIEADLKSDFLDVDQLFSIAWSGNSGESSAGRYQFGISGNVYLNFNCDVKRLQYKRFRGRNIRGDLLVKNKVAVSRKLAVETMGGDLVLSGIVDANNLKAIDVVCTSKLNRINADSIFYVFENFDQTFIEDRHLKGDVSADVNFELSLNENLRLYPETLVADISATLVNGQLNHFEPMQKLRKYLDDEGLNKLRFSELRNDIHIENKTVYIPQMQVNSNVTSIRVSGTHTFDQRIEYRIVTPLRGRKPTDQDFAKAVGSDEEGQTRLFLKITGTTDDYRVQYDTEAVRKKIASDLKREVRELKDAFKNKETQKKKELELQEDEYFEWSE